VSITANGGHGGDANLVSVTAGPDNETHGPFGSLRPIPSR
jgi:hypothetical protein